jgi:hypothetical protein
MDGWSHGADSVQVLAIAPFLPRLVRLDLVDNAPLTTLAPTQTVNGVPIFLQLKYLNVAGCGLGDWDAVMKGISGLTQ